MLRVRFLPDPFQHYRDTNDLVVLVSIVAGNLWQQTGRILSSETSDWTELTTSRNKQWSSPLSFFDDFVHVIFYFYFLFFPCG
jgi:hypothetical protein